MNMRYSNLSAASKFVSDFLDQSTEIPDEDKNFLINIQNRIRAIVTAQRGWIKYSLLGNSGITQDKVIAEARRAQRQTIGFTWITVNQLLNDIHEKKITSGTTEINRALTQLEKCCISVLEKISNNITSANTKNSAPFQQLQDVKLMDENVGNTESWHYSPNLLNKIVRALGGRMLPFAQEFDPLSGKCVSNSGYVTEFRGACLGHVKSWSDEVSEHGYAVSLPRMCDEVLQAQIEQSHPIIPDWASDYYTDTDFRAAIGEMTNALDPEKIYGLVISPHDEEFFSNSQHVIGIRKIDSTQSYEIADPNIGIIVFDDRDNFIVFLSYLLSNLYFSLLVDHETTVHSSLRLYQYGDQPANAKPSIPPLVNSDLKTPADEEMKVILSNLLYRLSDVAQSKNVTIQDDPERLRLRQYWLKNGLITIFMSGIMGIEAFSIPFTVLNKMFFKIPANSREEWLIAITGSLLSGAAGAIAGAETYSARYFTQWMLNYCLSTALSLGEWYTSSYGNKQNPKENEENAVAEYSSPKL